MLRVSRGVTMADWLRRDTLPAGAQAPPSIMAGPMKIGIRWKERIDLDLYATPRPGAETLYFEHVRSPEGYYYKDHRSSPGREYEFIEFESPVDVRELEAFVNFYKGSCPGGARRSSDRIRRQDLRPSILHTRGTRKSGSLRSVTARVLDPDSYSESARNSATANRDT